MTRKYVFPDLHRSRKRAQESISSLDGDTRTWNITIRAQKSQHSRAWNLVEDMGYDPNPYQADTNEPIVETLLPLLGT